VPDVARGDRRAALDAGSYRAFLERLVLWRLVLEQMAPEQSVLERLAAFEPQHLTSLAPWPAPQNPTPRPVREE